MVEKRKGEKQKHFLKKEKKKKKEARNISEQRDKGWIHIIRVHDTIHSANNMAGQQTLTNYPTQRMSGLVKNIETTPLTRAS